MSLDRVLGSRNRVRALRALFAGDGLSGRRVASRAGGSPSASQAALDELVAAGVVLRSGSPGKHSYELNRSHHLLPFLESLFEEEKKASARVVRLVRSHLAPRLVPPSTVWLVLAPEGSVSLALTPPPPPGDPGLARLRGALRFELGLGLAEPVETPARLPAGPRVQVLPADPWDAPRLSAARRDQALRFFDLAAPAGRHADG